MTDVADLRIRATTEGVNSAARELGNLTQAGGKAEKATDSLVGVIGKFASVAAVGAAAMAGFNKMLNVQRQFDVLNAGLTTATGSAQGATVAFGALQEFAAKTPYSLEQAVEGFTKLVNLGLTPSERALTSYGNTASAMGKDLSQMIEAVADASTGEFERLKEFGIKARQQGDQVQLTFQGVRTTVANEAGAIEDYLIKLGENEFAGAMERRMDSLDGALSNLGDAWDQMFLNVSQGGFGDAIAEGVNVASDALGALNDWLTSGEFEGAIESMKASWGPWVEDAKEAVDIVWGAIKSFGEWLNSTYPDDMQILSDAWRNFPENIRAFIQLAASHIAWFVEEVRIGAEATLNYLDAIADGWNGVQLKDVYAQTRAAEQNNNKTLADSTEEILRNTQATIDSARAARAAAIERANAAKKAREAERAAHPDGVLGQFGKGPRGGRPSAGGGGKPKRGGGRGTSDADRNNREYESLVEDLRTEEEALQASYDKRKTIIERQAGVEASVRADLMRRLEEWRTKEAAQIDEQKTREFESIKQSLMTEEEAIEASYAKRRQIVMDAQGVSDEVRAKTLERLDKQRAEDLSREQQDRQSKRDRLLEQFLSEEELARQSHDRQVQEQEQGYQQGLITYEEYLKNKAALDEQYHRTTMQLQLQRQSQTYDMYAGLFGSMAQLAGAFAQGQGKAAERAFKIQKALMYAQAIMNTAAGVSRALADYPAPTSYVYAAMAAAKGAVEVATISQQKFSGAYDKGGRIPAGKVGIVGERGMEFVEGPANVTGRQETARMLRQAADGGGGDVTNNNVTIQVVMDRNGGTSSSTTSSSDAADAEQAKKLGQLIDLRVRDVLIREQRQGGMLNPNSR